MDLFCLISLYFICILQKIELTESCLQDCTILQLQKQIQSSRHKPACVLFSKYVEEYTLKKKLCTLVKDRHSNERYASWNFNSFKYDERMPLPIQTPSVVPTVRCYLTPSQWYDYNDGSTVKHLHKWFQKLISIFDQRIPEASLAELDHSLHHHVLTAVGFYFISEHSYLEQLLMETQEAWRDKVNMLIVHPDSPDLRLISNKYSVKQSPSLIFIENSVKTHNEPVIQLALGPLDVNKQQIDLFMLIREMPVMTLTYAFDRVRQDMVDKDASIRFGIMEVNNSVRRVFEQTVRAAYKIGFPFSVLFSAKWHKTTVIGIDQIVIAERPTPGTFQEALTQHHFMLKSKEGKMLHLDLPWGHYEKTSGIFCAA
ncbi:hypothetical protein LSH36_173g01018 [Paralvinella palmiformis]|uniref:Uncharacterized protein n=1 Tax=Paralvinella palmiformis TaxID=53620 RepID=A0AAD9N8R5_9ANNE|nr:hypothetical protein LSH36_173g01018 [Paralvinella palmiformis]